MQGQRAAKAENFERHLQAMKSQKVLKAWVWNQKTFEAATLASKRVTPNESTPRRRQYHLSTHPHKDMKPVGCQPATKLSKVLERVQGEYPMRAMTDSAAIYGREQGTSASVPRSQTMHPPHITLPPT